MSTPGFVSTRAGSGAVPIGFVDAVKRGLAPDGGLFVPTYIPSIPRAAWGQAASLDELAANVLAHWMPESPEDLAGLTEDALSFPVPLVPLSGGPWQDVFVLELFHGPTLSFKDFGARTMARVLSHAGPTDGQGQTILVATSGDTGSAVADGFAGVPNTRVVLLYPKGRVSPTQELQLVVERPGVTTLAIEGAFDDCQALVKQAFVDPDLAGNRLSSANSINIGRLLPQSFYYYWAQVQLGVENALFCVPSGNLGNLTAGVFAKETGLPVCAFLAAHNRNDTFPLFLNSGKVAFKASAETPSSAMDVGAPSNFERLNTLYSVEQLQSFLAGDSISDALTIEEIARVKADTGYLSDPHTAVGLAAVRRYRERTRDNRPAVVLATAHPGKFPEVIHEALGVRPPVPDALSVLASRPRQSISMPPEYAAFKTFLLAQG